MSKTPRIIAATASAALLAATGAGAAVFAVDTVKDNADEGWTSQTEDAAPALKSAQDDTTTVYRAPSDDEAEGQGQLQPAPPSTKWQQPTGKSNKSGKSHSS